MAATVYVRVDLPEATPEEEAIECMREHAMATGRSCLINHPTLLTILVSPDGSVTAESLEPELQVAGGAISVGERGDDVGVMRVGRGDHRALTTSG